MLKGLFTSNDREFDGIMLCIVISVLGLVVLALVQAILNHVQIGIAEAGTGLGAVMGAGGAVRVSRDKLTGLSPNPQ